MKVGSKHTKPVLSVICVKLSISKIRGTFENICLHVTWRCMAALLLTQDAFHRVIDNINTQLPTFDFMTQYLFVLCETFHPEQET